MDTVVDLLLRHCEERGQAPRYIDNTTMPVEFDAGGAEIFVVSDFHAAAGMKKDVSYSGTENFFADDSFKRFLDYAHENSVNKRALLIINGDFIDFLRITSVPELPTEFTTWQSELQRIGIQKTIQDLRASISKDERKKYGLKTNDYKSVWKLYVAAQGHASLFDALAKWLHRGHAIVIVKGNHDLEWYWPAVRNYLRLILGETVAQQTAQSLEITLKTTVLAKVTFIDDSVILDREFYVEHGHRYEKMTDVVGKPVLKDKKDELNIPFGSFFNRYLFNRVELYYPFIDNVRPKGNILHLLLREHFFLGLKLLFYYLPFTWRMIPKRYYKFMFKPVVSYLVAIGAPLVFVLFLWGKRFIPLLFPTDQSVQPAGSFSGVIENYVLGTLKDGLLLFLSYAFSRLVVFFQLDEPSSLLTWAKELLRKYPNCRYCTMGHTHNPEQYEENGRWYINTSSWVPVVEATTAELREDRTYAVLHLNRDQQGKLLIHPLQRWNDDAGRLEPLVIVERK